MGEALASRQQVKTKAEIAEMSNSLPGQLNTHFSVYWYIHVKHLFVSKRNSFGGFHGNELGYFNKKNLFSCEIRSIRSLHFRHFGTGLIR